jgi:hypothetical protein
MPVDRFLDRIDRVREDVGHAVEGNFDRISEDTKREAAEAVRDHMEGVTRVEIPVNDRVTLEGRRERDGTIGVSLRVDL